MFDAWKAYLFGLRDDPGALLMAPVNSRMATYLNLLFRVVDTWPKNSANDYGAELEHIRKVVGNGKAEDPEG